MGSIKAVIKHAYSAEPQEKQKIKVDLDTPEQTLQGTHSHPEGLHQNPFVSLVV